MKKYFQYAFAIVAVTIFVIVGKNDSAVVQALTNFMSLANQGSGFAPQESTVLFSEPTAITITESGNYSLAGVCNFDVNYKNIVGVQNTIDVEVPLKDSSEVPFGYEGDIYLPGCHIVHYKLGDVVREASTTDGDWTVCFAERPDVELIVYHYYDDPGTDNQIWLELPTTHLDGLACAAAVYTGEYAPGSKVTQLPGSTQNDNANIPPIKVGTVLVPPPSTRITSSGTYGAGGICTFKTFYKAPQLSDDLHVADTLMEDHDLVDGYDNTQNAAFPDGAGLIYYPGCHVLHYEQEEIVLWEMTPEEGIWEICFAARPDKENTIYYYLGDLVNQASAWIALETRTEDGQACAPAQFTGVYVPTGK